MDVARRYIERPNWMREIKSIATRIDCEIYVLNSLCPLLIKKLWMEKAKIPPRLKIKEKIRPAVLFLSSKTIPRSIIKTRNKCNIRKKVILPGNLNNSHSFQYAESISWTIIKTAFATYNHNNNSGIQQYSIPNINFNTRTL
jgi:hypothetical protein